MTNPGLMALDPGFARALDLFDVPAASDGFLARAGAMPAADAPALPPAPRRRFLESGRRGAWVRRASVGIIALGLASATAATTGFFPAFTIPMPKFVATLNPLASPKPKVAHGHAHGRSVDASPLGSAAAAPLVVETPPLIQPPLPVGLPLGPAAQINRAIRREKAVDVIQQRLAARGVDVPKPLIRQTLARRQAARDVALGMVIRGDDRPLPPRMEKMRDRAKQFLEAHPQAAARLRDRVAASDAGLLPNAPIPQREAMALRPRLAPQEQPLREPALREPLLREPLLRAPVSPPANAAGTRDAPPPVAHDLGDAPHPMRPSLQADGAAPQQPLSAETSRAQRQRPGQFRPEQIQRFNEMRALRQQRMMLRRMRTP